ARAGRELPDGRLLADRRRDAARRDVAGRAVSLHRRAVCDRRRLPRLGRRAERARMERDRAAGGVGAARAVSAEEARRLRSGTRPRIDEREIRMNPSSIRTVAVVGCGTVGASWAALFLAHGLDVRATDPSPAADE